MLRASNPRAAAMFEAARHRNHCFTDRLFIALMLLQWFGAIVAAVVISPRTWIGETSYIHVHVWAAVVLGGLIASLPVALALLYPGARVTRYVISVAQVMFSALLIHLTGGRIETHFHIFGSLAFLAFYRDWTVMVLATVVVAFDHFVRGVYWPESVFGVLTASSWRWVEHAAWVLFEDVFLIILCHRSVAEMLAISERQAELEASHEKIELRVHERTAQLEDAMKAATQASEAKSAFLANMSHEIRTPMTSILGYVDVLEDAETCESQKTEARKTIRRSGAHLLQLINDILDISKIEAGEMRAARVECNPWQIACEVVDLMVVRADAKGIGLSIDATTPLPETIQSDPQRLRQILVNLVGNGVKFTERGNVALELHAQHEGNQVVMEFRVRDTGIGMTPEQLTRVFKPFTQADDSMTRRFGGTGLGLSITERLASLLGGKVVAESELGIGTTLSLVLRVQADDAGRMEACAPPSNDGVRETALHSPCDKLTARILLAEDGVDNQRLIMFYLNKAGASVELVENGELAVECAMRALDRGAPFDLVLMDMQMPVMDGYEAVRELRSRGYVGRIAALTAHAMSGDRARCLAVGCDDYLSKPVDRAMLLKRCRVLVGCQSEPEQAVA